jgi:hypothetical protein
MATTSALASAYPSLGRAFLEEVRAGCAGKAYSDWELLALMDFETGGTFDPSLRNSSGFVGLIQFGGAAARDLGTTTRELARMTRLEQLPYVFDYLEQRSGRRGQLEDLGDLYSAVLWPPGIGKPDSYTFFQSGDGYYGPNSALDTNGDGRVTKGEATSFVADRLRGGSSGGGSPGGGWFPSAPGGVAAGPNPVVVASTFAVVAGLFTYSLTDPSSSP